MRTDLDVQTAPDGTPLMPGRNGGLLRVGGGPPLDPVRRALRRARKELERSLDTLIEIRDNEKLDPEKRIKAALGIFTLSGVTREKPRVRKRSTFSVVTATPSEQAAKLNPPGPEPDPSLEPDPVKRGPNSR